MQNAKMWQNLRAPASFLQIAAIILSSLLLLAGCNDRGSSAGSERARAPESVNAQQILIMDRPPLIAASDPGEVETARRLMARLTPEALGNRNGARFLDASALPWLSGSSIGREFLSAPSPRVLVRGRPQAFCPIAFTETGDPGVPRETLARTALTRCLQQVPDGCGCRVVAVDDALITTREDVTYATGIAARIRARSAGLDGLLVAEEKRNGEILLRDLSGVIGTVAISKDNVAKVRLGTPAVVYEGTARDVGFRRGRLARRIYATNAAGERVSLLIGFDPGELAEIAGAWLAWPPDA